MTTSLQHPLAERLARLHTDLLAQRDGTPLASPPALADGDPDSFGLALATTTGRVHRAGDAEHPFSLQSAVKPFVYALALADSGVEKVLDAVGVEPTGEAFDAVRLESGTGRPPNPMVNAGAILTACLVDGGTARERTRRVVDGVSAFAGRRLEVDEQVFSQELRAGDRNRALAYLMASHGRLPVAVDDAVEVYLRSCALVVTAVDLAVMGATLAGGGVNPLTGDQVVPAGVVTTVLSVMGGCGMYDGSGAWLTRVGLPAKSGVGGGVVAVKPGQLGLGSWSPPLDERGNSVRGVLACERLSDDLGLHEFAPDATGVELVRSRRDGGAARSEAPRSDAERRALDEHGHRISVTELQGPFSVVAAELLCRLLLEDEPARPDPCWVVLDLRDVGHVHDAALGLATQAFEALGSHGTHVVLVDRERPHSAPWAGRTPDGTLDDVDDALRRCEDELLRHLARA